MCVASHNCIYTQQASGYRVFHIIQSVTHTDISFSLRTPEHSSEWHVHDSLSFLIRPSYIWIYSIFCQAQFPPKLQKHIVSLTLSGADSFRFCCWFWDMKTLNTMKEYECNFIWMEKSNSNTTRNYLIYFCNLGKVTI